MGFLRRKKKPNEPKKEVVVVTKKKNLAGNHNVYQVESPHAAPITEIVVPVSDSPPRPPPPTPQTKYNYVPPASRNDDDDINTYSNNGNKEPVLGRIISDFEHNTRTQPVFRDFASSNRDRVQPPLYPPSITPSLGNQHFHMMHLFYLAQKFTNETPPDRRQSLITATSETGSTPPPPIPFGDKTPPQHYQAKTKRFGSKNNNHQTAESSLINFLDVSKYVDNCSMSLCLPHGVDANNSPVPGRRGNHIPGYEIPREISFSYSTNEPSFLNGVQGTSSNYSVLSHMEEMTVRQPSLRKRFSLKRDNSVLSNVKVYADTPNYVSGGENDTISADGSTITNPSIQDGA